MPAESPQNIFSPQSPEEQPKRLTVECMVSIPTDIFMQVQNEIASLHPSFKPVQTENLHLTLGHFGRPDDLYNELLQTNSMLTRSDFDRALSALIQATEHACTNIFTIQAQKINIFDDGSVVLIVDKTALEQIQKNIYDATLDFLKTLQIDNASSYIGSQKTSNLYFLFPEHWKPHITFGQLPRDNNMRSHIPLPVEIPFHKSIPVTIQPSRIRNKFNM